MYLLGFNEYYQQKQSSLGQEEVNFEDTLFSENRSAIISRQEEWIQQAQEGRRDWINLWEDMWRG